MDSELVPITFNKIMQSRSYTVIVLGTNEKQFAIYTDPQLGRHIQAFLTTEKKPRPMTHDLMHAILRGFNAQPIQVVISDVQDTIYFARLYLEQMVDQKRTVLEIDARPSDCVILALKDNIPVFCTKEVLEKSIAIQE